VVVVVVSVTVWVVGSRRIAPDGVPVLVCARSKLHEQCLHSGELDVVSIAGGGVTFVSLRLLVSVVVPDEGKVF
jgi:hypothetical protein